MSVLTKLFVILMIVFSLLLTGGVVVFVNHVEDYRAASLQQAQALRQVQQERSDAQAQANAAMMREKDTARQLNAKIAEINAENQRKDQAIAAAGAQVTQLNNQIATLSAQGTAQAQALAAINQASKDLQARYDALVKANDDLRNRNAETNVVNTDLQKRLDEAERERRWLNEQVVQLKSDLDHAQNLLVQNNLNVNQATPVAQAPADVKGVVKAVKTQDGLTFATISLGSADHVGKGMQFIVVNPNTNQFLAKLSVEAVEPNEAFGRLDGPAVKDVQSGNVVMAQ